MAKKFSIESIYDTLHSRADIFFGVSRIFSFVEEFACDLDPDYQRGRVWTMEQQQNFIGFLLEGGVSHPVIINQGENFGGVDGEGSTEVLDGKQRISACMDFTNKEIGAKLTDGRVIQFDELDTYSLRMLRMQIGMTFRVVGLSRVEALRWYLKLNRGGTVHSNEEINRVQLLLDAMNVKKRRK